MKDRHQSATSLERLQGMTWLSRSRNMVTHPSLISLSWTIDWAFISIRLAFIASVMNGQTTDILRDQTCLLERKKGRKKKRRPSGCDSHRYPEPLRVESEHRQGNRSNTIMTRWLIRPEWFHQLLICCVQIVQICVVILYVIIWKCLRFATVSWNVFMLCFCQMCLNWNIIAAWIVFTVFSHELLCTPRWCSGRGLRRALTPWVECILGPTCSGSGDVMHFGYWKITVTVVLIECW